MARGGKRKGAGRPPSRPNKLTREQKATLTDIARAYTDDAVRTLVEIMKDQAAPHAARVSASNSVLDRAWGKAPQSLQHSGPNGGPIQTVDLTNMSEEQLNALEALFGPLATAGGDDEGDTGGEGEAAG
ncbi:MAG TPA: hypothetical protein VGO22_04930 [Pseudorhizobium sp.]|jgi:hypothetical protein|nr:hypothetical protein [Pseudorhizobium sp.]